MDIRFLVIYIFLVICFFVPSTAYAYLDPGTGNALIYVMLSLAGAALYFVKGLFYKLTGNRQTLKESISHGNNSIVIFSEGKAYWHVFKPIVDNLIEMKQSFSYFTMDIEDPCLQIDDQNMDNRYIGEGSVAYYKVSNLTANIVLSTTPNIGTPGYPITRSERIKKLVFVSHAFDDCSFFHRYSLDYYDVVLLVGKIEELSIRALEKVRNLSAKELVPAGLPYIDELLKRVTPAVDKQFQKENEVTVLLAPSWGKKGFLNYYDSGFIELLAKKQFNLIMRPHPQSWKVEKDLLQNIKKKLDKYKNITWDLNPDNSASLQAADILISDVSAIRYDFALVCQKPFITLPIPIPKETLDGYEIADMEKPWVEEAFREIGYGYTLKQDEFAQLDVIIMKILREKDNDAIKAFQNKYLYNLCNSGKAIAEYIINTNLTLQSVRTQENGK
jgi:hypothetical protein